MEAPIPVFIKSITVDTGFLIIFAIDEYSVLTYCSDESKRLNSQIRIDDFDPVSSMSPSLGTKCTEGEHSLIKVNHSCIWFVHLLYECKHAMKKWEIMRLREINLSLSSLDVLKPYLVLKIDATNSCGWDLHFSKHPVEHLCAFIQRQVITFLKCLRGDKITNLMLLELWTRVVLLWEPMNGGTNCSLTNSITVDTGFLIIFAIDV